MGKAVGVVQGLILLIFDAVVYIHVDVLTTINGIQLSV